MSQLDIVALVPSKYRVQRSQRQAQSKTITRLCAYLPRAKTGPSSRMSLTTSTHCQSNQSRCCNRLRMCARSQLVRRYRPRACAHSWPLPPLGRARAVSSVRRYRPRVARAVSSSCRCRPQVCARSQSNSPLQPSVVHAQSGGGGPTAAAAAAAAAAAGGGRAAATAAAAAEAAAVAAVTGGGVKESIQPAAAALGCARAACRCRPQSGVRAQSVQLPLPPSAGCARAVSSVAAAAFSRVCARSQYSCVRAVSSVAAAALGRVCARSQYSCPCRPQSGWRAQ